MSAHCQRWRNGRARYRPAGEVFNTACADVQTIDEGTAKAFTIQHHYARSYPAARFRVGLFIAAPFHMERLVGVAIFSVPMSQGVIPHHFQGLAPARGVELGRLVLLDDIAANAESWFVARAFRLLKERFADIDGVLSYSDPVERVDSGGNVVKRGHVGTVYQALNSAYLGRARGGTMILASDGRIVSRRALSKLRNDESGAAYAYQQLRAMGAPARAPMEEGIAYADRALREGGFRRVRHPGNHTYAWWLGESHRRPEWSPIAYPKDAA